MLELVEQIEGTARRADPWGSLAKDIAEARRRSPFVREPLSLEFMALSDEEQRLVIRRVNKVLEELDNV